MFRTFRSRLGLVVLLAVANSGLIWVLTSLLTPSPVISPAATAEPAGPRAGASSTTPIPEGSPSPVPGPVSSSPSPGASPSPSAQAVPLVGGELPPETAQLRYLPEGGFPVAVDGLQASCNRTADSLGLLGANLQAPLVARYQIAIAPFHGSGVYLTDAAHSQIGGSINIVGAVQLFIGPPFETRADIARDGALGQLRFTGTSVDGRRGEGTIRWECSETRPL